jgi:hypothetical protein
MSQSINTRSCDCNILPQRRTSEEPRESIDTGLELWDDTVTSVFSMNDRPTSRRGEKIGSSDNPGDAAANSNDLH